MINRLLLLLLVVFCLSCQPEVCTTELAFYHWKTHYAPDSLAEAYLQQLPTQRLYLRLFDIDWHPEQQRPVPKAIASLNQQLPPQVEIVPTIYITNRTLLQASPAQLETLSQQLLDKLSEYFPLTGVPQVQIDCDWTGNSREAYFQFLLMLRQLLPQPTQLSVTLRLHQYRWPEKTGVPPADRSMLMFYNMGDLNDWQEPNSILNLEKAQAYLQHTSTYPLPMDIALPLFRWGVLYRYGQMIRLINGLAVEQMDTTLIRPQDETNTRFRVTESTYLQGYYLYAGDEIRLEAVTPEQLLKAAKMLRPISCSGPRHLAFYHLDSTIVQAFPMEILRSVQQALQQETELE